MNKRQLVYLVFAAVLVVLIGIRVGHSRRKAWDVSATAVGQKILPELPVNDVTTIDIVDGDKTLQVVKREDKWRVAQRYDFPADYSKVSGLLRTLLDLKAAQQPVVGESQYGRLKLLPPGNGEESGIQLSLLADADRKVAGLLLGKEHERKARDDMGMGGMGSWPDGRYILNPDTGKLVLVSETFRTVKADPVEWLDKEFIKISDLKTGALSQDGTEVWRVTRATKSDEMKLDGLAEGEQQDDNKVRSIKTAFSWASFADVADPALADTETGLATPRTFVGEDFDGFTYTVRIGAKLADGRCYLAANVEYTGPTERTAETDETPEDKQKRDEEFKKKLEENQKKASSLRQRLKAWVFIVNSSTVDSILKERQDLVQEKKADADEPASMQPGADTHVAAPTTPPPPPPTPKIDPAEGDEPEAGLEGDVGPDADAAADADDAKPPAVQPGAGTDVKDRKAGD